MNLPNIPTDNLYKFIALTGLFILIVSFGFKEYRIYQHSIEDAEIIVGKEFIKNQIDNHLRLMELKQSLVNKELEWIESDYEKNTKESQALFGKKWKEAYANLINHADLNYLNIESKNLRLKSEYADASREQTERIKSAMTISMLIGVFAMISGFILWYIKLQRYQDLIIYKKSLVSTAQINELDE